MSLIRYVAVAPVWSRLFCAELCLWIYWLCDQVLVNGACRLRRECVTCTTETGDQVHAAGTWLKDPCTNCTCSGNLVGSSIVLHNPSPLTPPPPVLGDIWCFVGEEILRGLLYISTAWYFYKVFKTILHKPTGNCGKNIIYNKCVYKHIYNFYNKA